MVEPKITCPNINAFRDGLERILPELDRLGLDTLSDEVRSLLETAEALRTDNANLREWSHQIVRDLKDKENDLRDRDRDIVSLENDVEHLKQKLDEYQTYSAALESEKETLKETLTEATA